VVSFVPVAFRSAYSHHINSTFFGNVAVSPEEIRGFNVSLSIVRIVKSRTLRWHWHLIRWGDKKWALNFGGETSWKISHWKA